MLFPSSLISSRCRGTSRFIRPSPSNPFFPSARGPSCDHLRDICRVSRRAFHPGMSQRALHESRAMQWPRQVRRDECETRSNRVSTDNQTQHDNFHRCRSRSIRGNRWSERDRRTRPFKRKTKTPRGRRRRSEWESRDAERRERERERDGDGGKTHSLWTLAVLHSFGKRIIPWPSTAGAEKGAPECKPFNGLCAGTLLRIPLAFFSFFFFFRWIIATETVYPRVCRGYSVEDQRWGYRWREDEPYRFRIWMENLFYVKRRNVFLFSFYSW